MTIAIIAIIIAAILAANIFATWVATRSSLVTLRQKYMQVALIWLLPVVGATLVIVVLAPSRGAERSGYEGDSPDVTLTPGLHLGGTGNSGHDGQ